MKRGGAFFAVIVPDWTAATLLPLITQFVLPGTKIISDGWSAYGQIQNIQEQNYDHVAVNHSLHYVDPVTGLHTNTMEGMWNGMKKKIPRQGFKNDKMLQEYLGEQMWRRANKGRLWEAAMEALKKYKKPAAEIAEVDV